MEPKRQPLPEKPRPRPVKEPEPRPLREPPAPEPIRRPDPLHPPAPARDPRPKARSWLLWILKAKNKLVKKKR
ncbi:MAG TPA: hypothetical protein VGQ00_00995 [Candidatus Norongarragalinales archaeon]|nr:hypothetical protein [Candidatus Norongarragalinales archaeon]